MPWSTRFADPIDLPDGRRLVTLRDAGNHITALPKATQRLPHWQLAAELLLLVAERGGDPMLPRIAMLKAIHHGEPPPVEEPRRKHAKRFKIIN